MVSLLGERGNDAQRLGIDFLQISRLDPLGPRFEGLGSLGARLPHWFHHPFKNLGRAAMACITAAPSSSMTTPIPRGSDAIDGPMNMVTAGSSVSNARQ